MRNDDESDRRRTRKAAPQTLSEPATDEPFLNRVSHDSPVGARHCYGRVSVRTRSPGGLIFGLIRLRSSKFIGIRINMTMQVANLNGTQRTIIQTPENRMVGASTTARSPSRTGGPVGVQPLHLVTHATGPAGAPGVRVALPDAGIAGDHFYLIMLANSAVTLAYSAVTTGSC